MSIINNELEDMVAAPSQLESREQVSQSLQNLQTLPDDLTKVIGKVRLKIINIFSKIQAFFSTVIYGKTATWKGFWKDVDSTFIRLSSNRKLKLYNKYKSSQEKSYTSHVGYKVVSEEQAARLKKANRDLREYKAYKVKFNPQELKKIKLYLEKIAKGSIDGSNILIDLNKFLMCKDIPEEIKNLIEGKLKQIPAYPILKKKLEERILQRQREELDRIRLENQRQAEIARYNKIKKVALVAFVVAATFGIGFALYSYLKVASVAPVITTTTTTASTTAQSWKFLGRTSTEDVKNVIWQIGSLFKRPFEMSKSSTFRIL